MLKVDKRYHQKIKDKIHFFFFFFFLKNWFYKFFRIITEDF